MTHLTMEEMLDLAADRSLERPAHLRSCRECADEVSRLTLALGEDGSAGPPPLQWLDGVSAPSVAGGLGDFGRLVFGDSFARSGEHSDIAVLHPWFRDFLGEEPAARLAQRLVMTQH